MERRYRSWLSAALLLAVGMAASADDAARATVPLPEGTLDAARLTALFSGRTVLSRTVGKKRESTTYYHLDGSVRQLRKGQRRLGKWRVTANMRFCLQMESALEKCRIIVHENGGYRKYIVKKNGDHQPIVDYIRFWDGNPFAI